MTNRRRSILSLVALVLCLGAAGSASAGLQTKIDRSTFNPLQRPLAKDAQVRLHAIPLVDGEPQDVVLEQFEVFAPNADIKAFGDNGVVTRVERPNVRYFRGSVPGDDTSLVFISIEGDSGRVHGLVISGDRRFMLDSSRAPRVKGDGADTQTAQPDVFIQEVSVLDDMPEDGGFSCDLESAPLASVGDVRGEINGHRFETGTDSALSSSPNTLWMLNLAIETDFELYQNAGSSASNVTTFIGNLVGAAAVIYRRDLKTDLFVSSLTMNNTAADPFTVVPGQTGTWNGSPGTSFTTSHALAEFGDRWHNSPPSANARSSAVLISGKSQTAGVAWRGTICDGDFLCSGGNCGSSLFNGHYAGGYAYCGGIDPPGDNSVPNPEAGAPTYTVPASNYWPLLQFAHELGHNVGSPHTHCIPISTGSPTFVDNCYSGECYSGPTSVPPEKGTIMSYCHLFGATNSRWVFGKTGENSAVVITNMRADMQAATPPLSLITAPATMAAGATGNASVTNTGGVSYLWTITNGTINGSATGNTVNFTATTNPVTLKVKASNSGGCSVTDFVTVPVTTSTCTTTGVANDALHPYKASSGTVTVTSTCAWTATTDSNWISLVGPTGTGNGQFTFNVSDNLSRRKRTGTITIGTSVITITQWGLAARGDFNSDYEMDLLWRNKVTGEIRVWLLSGTDHIGDLTLPTEPNLNWIITGAGDLDGDGMQDILWRNTATGDNRVWFMDGQNFLSSVAIPSVPDQLWKMVSVLPFSLFGPYDLAWRHEGNGQNVMWFMDGATREATTTLPTVTDLTWKLVATGDFNSDTWVDLVWRSSTSGAVVVWFLISNDVASMTTMGTEANQNKQIVAIIDADRNTEPDPVFRDITTGALTVWRTAGGLNFGAPLSLGSEPNLNWEIVGGH